MDEVEEKGNPRLGVDDKRHLFMVLMSKTERLFFLNKFPVDQYDFALSLLEPDIEAAWRLLRAKVDTSTLAPRGSMHVPIVLEGKKTKFVLSSYHDDEDIPFMDVKYKPMKPDNRFLLQVNEWARRQIQLEDQMLRAIKVIRAIVHSCNTVGQYSRVSPELLGFLPSKYGDALKGMVKKSPYPTIECTKEEIDAAMTTLAFASLQPVHTDEEEFISRSHNAWYRSHYNLGIFPFTSKYRGRDCRSLQI